MVKLEERSMCICRLCVDRIAALRGSRGFALLFETPDAATPLLHAPWLYRDSPRQQQARSAHTQARAAAARGELREELPPLACQLAGPIHAGAPALAYCTTFPESLWCCVVYGNTIIIIIIIYRHHHTHPSRRPRAHSTSPPRTRLHSPPLLGG